mmetsp:Transcript_69907/g.138387  ORF Transcript_69907/g.138387 Transcript_69907/m.138387 type:complete len:501 (-) Transcript_69907:225-1727(-)|eukprot:CAMPEP_0172821912 /NCGR_PEP_ID=MMETSP1075-20121228/16311_1 /TAXON_ID=2916 /ORGANISM="Ceratium fusus, Strain PA161109" /LENGTH=500 /DNA_ID=CAMNT_0013662839 /DNA_START=77 /DNA_END=1579 /DNA_ORIENTATION=-
MALLFSCLVVAALLAPHQFSLVAGDSVQVNSSKPSGSGDSFVQLFEWKWVDVARECEDWLGPKGFKAVQVSPASDHINKTEWWARYQPVTLELTSRSGDEAQFVDMVTVCNKAGVDVYVDIVLNHVALTQNTTISFGGAEYGPRQTPVFMPKHMHHIRHNLSKNCQINNYQDRFNVQNCDLLGLPDLCTGCDFVQKKLAQYMIRLLDLGVAGFRIDAAKHVDPKDIEEMQKLVDPDQKVYWFQEVFSNEGEAVTMDQYSSTGALEFFHYARHLGPAFLAPGNLKTLDKLGLGFRPSNESVVFLDNHDTQRAEAKLTYREGKLYELATIYMLAHPYGYPRIMSSYYFHSHDQGPPKSHVHNDYGVHCGGSPMVVDESPGREWVCEHRWTSVASMVRWRRSAGEEPIGAFWAMDGNRQFFCRGKVACIVFNRDEVSPWNVTLNLPLPAGPYCDVIRSDNSIDCPALDVNKDGKTEFNLEPLSAVALHVGKLARKTALRSLLV